MAMRPSTVSSPSSKINGSAMLLSSRVPEHENQKRHHYDREADYRQRPSHKVNRPALGHKVIVAPGERGARMLLAAIVCIRAGPRRDPHICSQHLPLVLGMPAVGNVLAMRVTDDQPCNQPDDRYDRDTKHA